MIWKGREMLSGPHKLPWNTEPEGIFPALGKVFFFFMATHSSVLTWRIPGMAEPGGLLSIGLHRVRHPGLEARFPARRREDQPGATHVSHTPAACSFPGENARSWDI